MKKKPDLSDSLKSWLNYLEEIHPLHIELGLERIDAVRKKCNINPSFPIILVAGTNGKGSTSKYLESIFNEAKLKVACYTSPHIKKFNERIRVNKKEVSDARLKNAIHFIDSNRGSISLTFFEITTLAAMHIFTKNNVDVCVMEVGLGGRLDATNIFDPEVSIITSINFDHQDYLGDTLEKIGYEKAGILRGGKPAVLNFKNIPKAITKHASKIGSNLSLIYKDYNYEIEGQKYTYISQSSQINSIEILDNNSEVQVINAMGAIRCVDLMQKFFKISNDCIKLGIKNTFIQARSEVISRKPLIIIDVAHNFEAAENLLNVFNHSKNKGITRATFSILKNKDLTKIIQLFNAVDEWYIAELKNTRALKIDQLENILRKTYPQKKINVFKNIKNAYTSALSNSKENDNILLFGSFFTIDEAGVKL